MDNCKILLFARIMLAAILMYSLTSVTRADEVKMTFTVSSPPYFIAKTKRGIEVDIIREALAVHGHTLKPYFVPPKRVLFDFKLGKVDAASKDHAEDTSEIKAFRGDIYVYFHDAFISLEENDLRIVDPSDLSILRVMAFQTATNLYPKWLNGVKDGVNYSETSDQTNQLKKLHTGRTDILLGDQIIMRYLSKLIAQETKIKLKPVRITQFTKPWGYGPLFRSSKLRDQFNDGLRKLRLSGRYQEIIDSYVY